MSAAEPAARGSEGPAFYVRGRGRARDCIAILHPPYTAWHLAYVAIGALIAPRVRWWLLGAMLLAFLLAVGVAAHALDELRGRPLGTELPAAVLVTASVLALAGAVVLGAVAVGAVGLWLVAFIVVGVALVVGYNLELLGGRLHNDATFVLAWGAFPVLTGYFSQAETLRWDALAASVAACGLSLAQRRLSTPARTLRRRAAEVVGELRLADGGRVALSRPTLLAPIESALRAMSWAVVALAVALALGRLGR